MKMIKCVALVLGLNIMAAFGAAEGHSLNEVEVYLSNVSPGHEVLVHWNSAGFPTVSKKLVANTDVVYLGKVSHYDRIWYQISGALKTYPTTWIEWQDIESQKSPRVLVQFYKGLLFPGVKISAFSGLASLHFKGDRFIKALQVEALHDALKLIRKIHANSSADPEQELANIEDYINRAGLDSEKTGDLLQGITSYRQTRNPDILRTLDGVITEYYQAADLELQTMG